MPHPNVPPPAGGNDRASLLPTLLRLTSRGGQAGESKHQWLQLALAVLLPILIRLVLPTLQNALNRSGARLERRATRSISHTRDVGVWR